MKTICNSRIRYRLNEKKEQPSLEYVDGSVSLKYLETVEKFNVCVYYIKFREIREKKNIIPEWGSYEIKYNIFGSVSGRYDLDVLHVNDQPLILCHKIEKNPLSDYYFDKGFEYTVILKKNRNQSNNHTRDNINYIFLNQNQLSQTIPKLFFTITNPHAKPVRIPIKLRFIDFYIRIEY
jgi:hypothetical protein